MEWDMQGLKWGMAALLAAGFAVPALAETTVLTNLTLIDGVSAAAQPGSAIVMTDGKIAWVGPMSGLKTPKGATVQD
jgi:imidazolonepropionase-like amidohydrolase